MNDDRHLTKEECRALAKARHSSGKKVGGDADIAELIAQKDAEIKRLREALEPFAKMRAARGTPDEAFLKAEHSPAEIHHNFVSPIDGIRFGDIRRAALAGKGE